MGFDNTIKTKNIDFILTNFFQRKKNFIYTFFGKKINKGPRGI